MEIRYLPQQVGMPTAAGAVFELDENNFLIVGMMCNVCVHTKPGDHRKVDFIRKEAEHTVTDNGDAAETERR